MKDLESETAKKDERFKELLEVYRQLPKNINRSVYTNRILEIVKQVKKQKVDISKVRTNQTIRSLFLACPIDTKHSRFCWIIETCKRKSTRLWKLWAEHLQWQTR